MTIEEALQERLRSAADELHASGFVKLLAALIRDVWATNVARSDSRLGDTVRLLGITSAENLTTRLGWLRREPEWIETEVTVDFRQNSMLVKCGTSRIHVMKAPQSSRRQPDWHHDFPWANQSNVRAESAHKVDDAYRAPVEVPGMEPMFPADGLGHFGDPAGICEFFIVWAGEISEDPLTAAWIIIPTLGKMQVLAHESLWFDESGDESSTRNSAGPQEPDVGGAEPEVKISIKTGPRRTGDNRVA